MDKRTGDGCGASHPRAAVANERCLKSVSWTTNQFPDEASTKVVLAQGTQEPPYSRDPMLSRTQAIYLSKQIQLLFRKLGKSIARSLSVLQLGCLEGCPADPLPTLSSSHELSDHLPDSEAQPGSVHPLQPEGTGLRTLS